MMLSQNFSLDEFITSQTAARLGIDNTPSPQIISNLTILAAKLEEVRSYLNAPIIISSGYRCLQLNSAVGGVSSSAHVQGYAADILCPQFGNPLAVCTKIKQSGIVFDQLIYEFRSWTHISVAPTHRGQILTINNSTGGYVNGLVA